MTYIVRFFIGKGGVGKTTVAATYALKQAGKGRRTYVISLDPAHNLGDVFDMELGDKPRKITDNLWGIEVDYEAMIRKHLKNLTEKIKDIYGYLKIFNLDKYVDVLQHSPGVEEQASLEKIIELTRILGEKGRADVIVYDTPPTGLMLRIMALPTISLIWIDKLLDLRLAILEKRRAIEKITGEEMKAVIAGRELKVPTSQEEDPIYKELLHLREEYTWINNLFTDHRRTRVALVINPETLPVLEAYRAYSFLERIGVLVSYIVVNKYLELEGPLPESLAGKKREQDEAMSKAKKLFKGLEFYNIPYQPWEPRGLGKLSKLIKYVEDME